MRFIAAADLHSFGNGQLARDCGIVAVRQRPGTANGVVFVTLEDETGKGNVIIWSSLVEQQRGEVMAASLLSVYGVWQCDNDVRNLVAKRLVDLSHMLGELDARSRNFHCRLRRQFSDVGITRRQALRGSPAAGRLPIAWRSTLQKLLSE